MKREMIVVPYNNEWNERYKEIHSVLATILSEIVLDIQHFGSTAINGMPSKPIIDVMVIVTDITKVDKYNADMITAGYVPKGENGIIGRRYFQKFASDGINHIEHIHCYESNNPHAVDELMFRDYLRINKEAFELYKQVKIEAAEKYRYSPGEYTDYKAQCVNAILENARKYYNGQG